MAHIKFHHYYMYDIGSNVDDKKYDFGEMEIVGNKLMKTASKMNELQWVDKIKKGIEQLNSGKNGLIVYIHGYQGDNKYFMQQSGYIIQKEIFDQPEHRYGMAISLQWKSVLAYDKAVKNAYEKGKKFVTLLDRIYHCLKVSHPEAPVAFIAHSMGNRVWQGVYENWVNVRQDLKINVAMMFAADLDRKVFCTGFPEIEKAVQQIYVYHHWHDRTLLMANTLNAHPRLGIFGPDLPLPDSLHDIVIVRNATDIKDDESFAGNLTYHRYYYGSPTIRNEIVDILAQ